MDIFSLTPYLSICLSIYVPLSKLSKAKIWFETSWWHLDDSLAVSFPQHLCDFESRMSEILRLARKTNRRGIRSLAPATRMSEDQDTWNVKVFTPSTNWDKIEHLDLYITVDAKCATKTSLISDAVPFLLAENVNHVLRSTSPFDARKS